MTNEEAIKTIEIAIAEVEWEYPMEYAVAFEMAIDALKKQMPKKPIDKHYEEQGEKPYIKYACPACGFSVNAVGAEEKAYQNRYCHKCGQALDWSKGND